MSQEEVFQHLNRQPRILYPPDKKINMYKAELGFPQKILISYFRDQKT